jgi:hypothetical protein
MAEHWPTATDEYAAFMNNLPKVVFSKTLPAITRRAGSRIASGHGPRWLYLRSGALQAGMIDEYRLVIPPSSLGSGLPLFKELAKPLRLELKEGRSFPGGTVEINVYQPIRSSR